MRKPTIPEAFLAFAGLGVAIWAANEASENNDLQQKLVEYQEAQFRYEAVIADGDLVVSNTGDQNLVPDEVRAIPVFPFDTSTNPSDPGINVPFAEVRMRPDGTRVFEDIGNAICTSLRFSSQCNHGRPSQLVLVFEFEGIQRRTTAAF